MCTSAEVMELKRTTYISCAGCILQTYKTFVDTNPNNISDGACYKSLEELNESGSYPPLCATAQAYKPGGAPQYCPTQQPSYSAFRCALLSQLCWEQGCCANVHRH